MGCTCSYVCHYAGYYPAGGAPKTNAQAQIDMIEETLQWAGVESVKSVGHPDEPLLGQYASVWCRECEQLP